jgi:integrase
VYLSALRSWANFAEDAALRRRLDSIKLPPALRKNPKVELDRVSWRRLVKHLQDQPPSAMRSVLLIISLRGLRCGDVLRLRRREIEDALSTGLLSFEAKGSRRLEYDAAPIREHLQDLAAQAPLGNAQWQRVRDLLGPCHDSATRAVRRSLARHAVGLGIEDLHPHRLRRTYATHYIRALDKDPQALMKLQRHMQWQSMQTAAGYVDATNAKELDAIGARMVDELMRDQD